MGSRPSFRGMNVVVTQAGEHHMNARLILVGAVVGLVCVLNSAQAQHFLSKSKGTGEVIPESGSFYSAKHEEWPPLPFNPHPECEVIRISEGVFLIDDFAIEDAPLESSANGLFSESDRLWASGSESLSAASATLELGAGVASLRWNSASNIYYEIMFRTNLSDPADFWFTLEPGYPSHGTNTFWKDTGYFGLISPPGQDFSRFYKIIGRTNGPNPPSVTVTVTNGVLAGIVNVDVTVTSSAAIMGARLYVDGGYVDEINSDSGTILLDTADFTNGSHTIFVAAESESGFESTDEGTNNTVNTTSFGLSQMAIRQFSNAPPSSEASIFLNRAYPPPSVTNTFGIMFQGSQPSWKDLGENVNWVGPWNGLNNYVILHGDTSDPEGFTIPRPYGPLRSASRISFGFASGLGSSGHQLKFALNDSGMEQADYLRSPQWGGVSKFNEVNFGFLIGHGVHGLSVDYTTGLPPVKDTYFPVWTRGNQFYDWIPLSQCDFGSSELRWMAMLSCNNLVEPNVSDLNAKKFANELIVNGNLHLLLGTGATVYMLSNFGHIFGEACARGTNGTPMTIREAWFYAGEKTQGINNPHPGVPVKFTVVGWPSCWNDTIYSFSEPDTSEPVMIQTRQVYPLP